MNLLVVLIILLLLFGGGGYYAGGPRIGTLSVSSMTVLPGEPAREPFNLRFSQYTVTSDARDVERADERSR